MATLTVFHISGNWFVFIHSHSH